MMVALTLGEFILIMMSTLRFVDEKLALSSSLA
jgi:hypothetical protein